MPEIRDLPTGIQTSANLLRRRLQSFLLKASSLGLPAGEYACSFAHHPLVASGQKKAADVHWHAPQTTVAADLTFYHIPEDSVLIVWYRYSEEELKGQT